MQRKNKLKNSDSKKIKKVEKNTLQNSFTMIRYQTLTAQAVGHGLIAQLVRAHA